MPRRGGFQTRLCIRPSPEKWKQCRIYLVILVYLLGLAEEPEVLTSVSGISDVSGPCISVKITALNIGPLCTHTVRQTLIAKNGKCVSVGQAIQLIPR